jgi:predicted CoA-substrate-specific enzyme activase
MQTNPIHIGLDVGSVSVKMAAWIPRELTKDLKSPLEESIRFSIHRSSLQNETGFNDQVLLLSDYTRHMGEPLEKTSEMLSALRRFLNAVDVPAVRATGSGGKEAAKAFGFSYMNEYRAIAEGMGLLHPEVRTVLEMGGGNSKYIRLSRTADGSVTIEDYETNGECAAGTGLFFDQQVERLEIRIEDVGSLVRKTRRSATIAGRCSVFAKSDMIHAQQRGFTPPEILKGLCESVVRNFKGSILKGRDVVPMAALIGGVSANAGVADAFRSVFELQNGRLLVPELGPWIGAIGAAGFGARGNRSSGFRVPGSEIKDSMDEIRNSEKAVHRASGIGHRGTEIGIQNSEIHAFNSKLETRNLKLSFPHTQPLSMDKVVLLRDRVESVQLPANCNIQAFLGIDIGSVSTNLALVTEKGDLIHGIYTMTRGKPIEVVGECLKEMESHAGCVELRGVGTTGSGRDLIGMLVGADTVKDEITAHKTGAVHVAKTFLGRDVDTIFEVGGQDSKFISMKRGVVVDFCLNEACAAGTGSFLEEQARQIGVAIRGEFSALALRSANPLKLGERCTVFMSRELGPYLQKGVPKEDLVAGLALSVVLNYLNRVVKKRVIGETIFFQGGTAYNDAVAAAFATLLDREIIVPPHNGIMGAIGAALLARDRANPSGTSHFRGWHIENVPRSLREFTCKACPNRCAIQEFTVAGEKSHWGDKCSDRYRKRTRTDRKAVIPNLIRFREHLTEPFRTAGPRPTSPRGRTGIPLALFFHDRLPFWKTYLEALGFDCAFSGTTNQELVSAGVEACVNEPCFPIQAAHGHLVRLMGENPDFVFFPNTVNEQDPLHSVASFLCPWVQTLPLVAKHVQTLEPIRDRILCPRVQFRDGRDAVERQLFKQMSCWRIRSGEHRFAVQKAYEVQEAFNAKIIEQGAEVLQTLSDRNAPAVVLVGRPYNLYDPGMNLNIPQKLAEIYGANVIPMDFLPIDGIDIRPVNDHMFWNYGRRILQAAAFVRDYTKFQIVYISNFKCGPDSYIRHYVEEAAGKPFLFLQLDSHSNDAGVMTRIEAFLESKGML